MSVRNNLMVLLETDLDKSENSLVVFHGTTTKKINDIKRNGLISPTGYDSASWYMVSTNFGSALYHCNVDKELGVMPVVVEFNIPIDILKNKWEGYPYFWPPYERHTGDKWYALKMKIPKQYITKIHNVDYDEYINQKNKGF